MSIQANVQVDRLLVLCALAAGCGGATVSSAWNPKAAGELKAETGLIFTRIDAGDIAAIKASLDDQPAVFDVDPSNKVVAAYGAAETNAYMDTVMAAMKQGLKVKSTVNRVDCQATSVLGFCTVEFDQAMAMGGTNLGPYKFRGTTVFRKVGSAWKWSHWHGSFREVPQETPASAAATK
jgi:hypothetical protein